MERLLVLVMPSARVAAAGSGCGSSSLSWPRRLLGHGPGAVMTAVEDVTRREACSRLAKVLEAQPGVAASTQRDRRPLGAVFDTRVAQHGSLLSIVIGAAAATGMRASPTAKRTSRSPSPRRVRGATACPGESGPRRRRFGAASGLTWERSAYRSPV